MLARVEGEGSLYLKVENDQVVAAQLGIFEPPRFFEAFLRGRDFQEAPDITARICGICPIAYQMGACYAMEDILGVTLDEPLRELRRLIYCGEWIESHVLHIYMLHAPDFLGYDSAIAMAKDFPEAVQRGLKLKKMGNEIMQVLGGREIHPINVKVGGFYKLPSRQKMSELREQLLWARDAAIDTVHWASGFDFPDYTQDYELISLSHPDEYPLNEGRLISNKGLDIPIAHFNDNFTEVHVEHSNALHCRRNEGDAYLVGPLARYHHNYDKLTDLTKETAKEIDFPQSCNNPFKSIIVRSLEVLYACDEAIRILDSYDPTVSPSVELEVKPGIGHGCTEAPRGICYHRYEIDEEGKIVDAQIVPPTSQNQKSIEADLFHFASDRLHLSEEELTWQCEQAIRNYDPCISCATHFLKLDIERS